MKKPSPGELSSRAAARIAQLGVTQMELSSRLKMSQSQISRLLSGKCRRTSKGLRKLCDYAYSYTPSVTKAQIAANEQLMTALQATWNGTPDHASALATVIRSLQLFETRGDKEG